VTEDEPGLSLQEGLIRSGMSYSELWLRQLEVGGEAGRLEVEAYVLGVLAVDPHQHDVLAQALNEHFLEHDRDQPVGYWTGISASDQ
jgi:hypothetical protein